MLDTAGFEKMGRIREPPKPTRHKTPFGEWAQGTVVTWVKECEEYPDSDYMYVLELINWPEGTESLRFGYYFRRKGSGEKGWIWGQRPAIINPETLKRLIEKARANSKLRKFFE